MPTLFFTSDHHFGHRNIIRYSGRPFKNAREMDETMIARWNERVGPDDVVFHLGDIGLSPPDVLRPILNRLNGRIYLIRGNHEKSALACADRFVWVKDYHELHVKDPDTGSGRRLIVLFHYAMRVWNAGHYGSWHLYGHSHGHLPDDPNYRCIDVGVDCHNFYPLSYEEVKALMAQKTWAPPFGKGE